MAVDDCQATLDELWDRIGCYDFDSRACSDDESTNKESTESLSAADMKVETNGKLGLHNIRTISSPQPYPKSEKSSEHQSSAEPRQGTPAHAGATATIKGSSTIPDFNSCSNSERSYETVISNKKNTLCTIGEGTGGVFQRPQPRSNSLYSIFPSGPRLLSCCDVTMISSGAALPDTGDEAVCGMSLSKVTIKQESQIETVGGQVHRMNGLCENDLINGSAVTKRHCDTDVMTRAGAHYASPSTETGPAMEGSTSCGKTKVENESLFPGDTRFAEGGGQKIHNIKQEERTNECCRGEPVCEKAGTNYGKPCIKVENATDDFQSVAGYNIRIHGESFVKSTVPAIKQEDKNTDNENSRNIPRRGLRDIASEISTLDNTENFLRNPKIVVAKGGDNGNTRSHTAQDKEFVGILKEENDQAKITNEFTTSCVNLSQAETRNNIGQYSSAENEENGGMWNDRRNAVKEEGCAEITDGSATSCGSSMEVKTSINKAQCIKAESDENCNKNERINLLSGPVELGVSEDLVRDIPDCASVAHADESVMPRNREHQISDFPMDSNSEEEQKTWYEVRHIDDQKKERSQRKAAQKARRAWNNAREDSESEMGNDERDGDDEYTPVETDKDNSESEVGSNEHDGGDECTPLESGKKQTQSSWGSHFHQRVRDYHKRGLSDIADDQKDHGLSPRKVARKSESVQHSDSDDIKTDENDSGDDNTTKESLETDHERSSSESYFHQRVRDYQKRGKFVAHPAEEISKNVSCHPIRNSRALKYVCKICNKDWSDLVTMIKHSISHLSGTRYFCQRCGRTFFSESIYKVHLDFHRLGIWREIKEPGSRRHTCRKCHKFFADANLLIDHSKVHSREDRPYECGCCDKKFRTTRERQKHELTHKTKDRRLKCPQCMATSSDRSTLARHRKMHKLYNEEINGYRCDKCEATFSSLAKLRLHVRTHDANCIPCERCGQLFKELLHLEYHKPHCKYGEGSLQGLKSKDHACEVCDERFRLPWMVARHMTVHTRQRPYSCQHCDMSFQQPSARDRHQALHYKDGKFREVKRHTIKVKKGKDGRIYS